MVAPLQIPQIHTANSSTYRWLWAALGLSYCLHIALYEAFASRGQVHEMHESREMVMEVNSTPPPPPPPEVKKPPPAPRPKAPVVKAPVVPLPHQATPPPNEVPAKPAAPVPVHIGVSLSSTTQAGGFAVPVGNSMGGKADRQAADPNQSRPYSAPQNFVPSYDVTESPAVDAEPDLQAYYPENARKQNQEAQVRLALTLDARGTVVHAKVLRAAGNGFDEAAVRAAMERLHFKPARVNGKAVSTEITYTITFILD